MVLKKNKNNTERFEKKESCEKKYSNVQSKEWPEQTVEERRWELWAGVSWTWTATEKMRN